jgi:hypothetical protein
MIGMLQIITYLLCVYLIFRGATILQIAICSPKPNNRAGVTLGVIALVMSVLLAGFFIVRMEQITNSMADQLQQNPLLR